MLTLLRRASAWLRRNRLDDDVAEEIRLHIELRRQALIDDGMTPADADREARRQFGNVAVIRERAREEWVSLHRHAETAATIGLRPTRRPPFVGAVAARL